MNDIYKQKAKKYKYKYLKLKREYLGEGGGYLGEGTYGCIISPPIQFNHIVELQCNSTIKDFYNNNYIGKLLNCNKYKNIKTDIEKNDFEEEYNSFINLDNIDPDGIYRSKLIYAAIISRNELNKLDYRTINCANKVLNRVYVDYQILTDENYNNNNFGYIVSTKVGESFDKIKFNQFNKQQIINFLIAFKNSIDFIKILYDKKNIHADIKIQNMTYDKKLKKVYFIDFGFLHNYDENENIIKQIYHYEIYPYILFLYFEIEKDYKKNNITTITKLPLIEALKKKFKNNNNNNKKIFQLIKMKDNDIDEYFKQLFKLLNDKEEQTFIYIYYLCIVPIIKNIDIYSLSFIIYQLFFWIF